MKYAVLGLGSNSIDTGEMLAEARRRLAAGGCDILRESGVYAVDPPYSNQALLVATSMDYAALRSLTKDIESAMGRTPQSKASGIVPIDIDIVLFEGHLLRPSDFSTPYFRVSYLDLIK